MSCKGGRECEELHEANCASEIPGASAKGFNALCPRAVDFLRHSK